MRHPSQTVRYVYVYMLNNKSSHSSYHVLNFKPTLPSPGQTIQEKLGHHFPSYIIYK